MKLQTPAESGVNGLWVYDLVNSPPTFVTKVATGGYFADLNISGNLCAVAALGHGLLLYDVSYTAILALRGTYFDNWRQVSAVCLAPNRAYIGIDEDIAIIDTTNPTSPTLLGSLNIGAFTLDRSLEGTTLAAATDGGGVVLLDVSGATPLTRSAVLKVERVHGVAKAGGRLVAAGGPQGVAVYDIANPAAPVDRGSVPLTVNAYDVILDGTHAYVSAGRRRLAVVDIGGPTPVAQGIALMGASGGGSAEANLLTLRASIDEAEQRENLAQRRNALFVDALKAAMGAGFVLDGYKGVIVVVNGPFLRGDSNPRQTQFTHEDTGETLRLNDTKGLLLCSRWRDVGAHSSRDGPLARNVGHLRGVAVRRHTVERIRGRLVHVGPDRLWAPLRRAPNQRDYAFLLGSKLAATHVVTHRATAR